MWVCFTKLIPTKRSEVEEKKELSLSLLCEWQNFPSAFLLFVCSLTWTGRRSWTWGCSEEQRSAPWGQGVVCYICCWAVPEVRRILATKVSHVWISLAQNTLLSLRAHVCLCSMVDQETWIPAWNWVIHLGTAGAFQQCWWCGVWGSFTGHAPSWFLLLALTSYSSHVPLLLLLQSHSVCHFSISISSFATSWSSTVHLLPAIAKCFIWHALHRSTWDNWFMFSGRYTDCLGHSLKTEPKILKCTATLS